MKLTGASSNFLLRVALSSLLTGCQCFVPTTEDSGARPEECDGIDNDKNGRVDDAPDGGPLTQPGCPLTLGVCAGAVSVCRDGGWAPCDYGPSYQHTERTCDGLDNDCDGRTDVSWARRLLTADAGGVRLPWLGLTVLDTLGPEVHVFDAGMWVVLPTRTLVVNGDLEVVEAIDFPPTAVRTSSLIQDGNDWMRFAGDYQPGSPQGPLCVNVHRVFRDGGSPSDDGGLVLVGRPCWVGPYYFAAMAVPDGWFVVAMGGYGPGDVDWAWLGRDGGTSMGTTAGSLDRLTEVMLGVQAGRFVIEAFHRGSPGLTEVLEFVPATRTLSPLLTLDAGNCFSLDSTPPAFSCWAGMATYFALDGGSLSPPLDAYLWWNPRRSMDCSCWRRAVGPPPQPSVPSSMAA